MASELSVIEIGGITATSILAFLLFVFLFGPEHLRLRAGNAINVILSCLGRQQVDNLTDTTTTTTTTAVSPVKQTQKTNSVKMCGVPLFECIEVLDLDNCIYPLEQDFKV